LEFKLNENFIEKYKNIKPNFGFNGLGELTYYRTYSRLKEDGTNEQWFETVERVVNGCYSIQKEHIIKHDLDWRERKAQISAQEMYDRMFNFKFLPPGRGLWAMGTGLIKRNLAAALNNCAFVSTEFIEKDWSKPFCFMMDMSMLGVGVGFDVKGADKVMIWEPARDKSETFIIPDTREGWVESIKLLIESYFDVSERPTVEFDYSLIRKEGELIKTFGGISSGPDPLKKLHKQIRKVLDAGIGEPITETQIADIMNMIGVCVVAGNVRRSAQIMFGNSEEFMDLKNYKKNKHRQEYGWTSNNSIFAEVGQSYSDAAERTALNGEPGYFWLDNARKYGRMIDGINWKDKRASGGNPCLEQTLENYELCCLVETFPFNHKDLEDYKKTLKYAYLYAKSVTLLKTHWKETNKVLLRNRRIGLSQTGIAQFLQKFNIEEYRQWCDTGYKVVQSYDEIYSNWFCVPRSIKTTSIKPSGTISLLAGATPGMHFPESNHYIRRIRVSYQSSFVDTYRNAGYKVEPDKYDNTSCVIEFPVYVGGKTLKDVTLWEQVALASMIQTWWADNQVSCTVTFNKDEEKQIEPALNYFQYSLKGISFLPKLEGGAYEQMPYEEITEKEYNKMMYNIKEVESGIIREDSKPELYCDSDKCTI
jgi:ribonucleoside-triphosphate reductase